MTTTSVANLSQGLTLDRIAAACPSVFATAPHESRSRKYEFISTATVLEALMHHGFTPVSVMQAGARAEGRQEHTKHMIRLRYADHMAMRLPEAPEIVLINSSDGSSSYQIAAGVLRFVCSNGMIVGDIAHRMKIRHTGTVVQEVVEGSLTLVEQLPEVMQTVEEMKAVTLSPKEQLLLAQYGMLNRFETVEDEQGSKQINQALVPYQPQDFLRVRRSEDRSEDLWTVFNRVQENLMKGGIRRYVRGERKTTRAIKGIDQTVGINTALWQFSEELLKLKTGRPLTCEQQQPVVVEACPF